MIDVQLAIETLAKNAVDFVIIGGVAINIHSSSYVTYDFDFCYLRTTENLKRISTALAPFKPRFRDFPEDLPFFWDERTLLNGTNFTLQTNIGDIDLLGEVSGIGNFDAVEKASETKILYGFDVKVLTVEGLISAKRAAGRTKDLLVLPELETLHEVLKEAEN